MKKNTHVLVAKDVTVLPNGQKLFNVHDSSKCAGRPCCIHNPSDHHEIDWPQNWRGDRRMMERICPHGIGHPDPDDPTTDTVHGCDGCCIPPTARAFEWEYRGVAHGEVEIRGGHNMEFYPHLLNLADGWCSAHGAYCVEEDAVGPHSRTGKPISTALSRHELLAAREAILRAATKRRHPSYKGLKRELRRTS